jgi:NADH-quinone oxidoreductase subunit N
VTEAIEQIQRTASLLVPEIILLATVCFLFLTGPLAVSDAGDATPGLRHRWGFLSLLALALATIVWSGGAPDAVEQGALFHIDPLVWYTRGISLFGGILLVLVLWSQIDDAIAAEAHACLLAIVAGTTLVAAASDLVSLFLALELVSIPTYVILYLPRRDRAGREAAIKYFLLSVFSSALVLYGMAWLYGVAGSTNLAAIAGTMSGDGAPADNGLLSLAFALLLAGLCFRITAVPFHFYAPDVFQGTTASNAALLSYVPKVVGFVALVRLLPLSGATASFATWLPNDTARTLLAVLSIVTMFVGNLMALRQKSLYRLMAYSSVAHAGYMLVGLAAGDAGTIGGTSALMFYLAVYGLMTIGVFALIGQGAAGGERGAQPAISTIDDLRALGQLQPATALLLTVCLFSLTGLPPTAGFLAKLNLFLAAWSDGTTTGRTLAVIMAINAAIGAWYYLRLIALMFLEPIAVTSSALPPQRIAWSSWIAGVACTAATVAIFLAPQWLWDSMP